MSEEGVVLHCDIFVIVSQPVFPHLELLSRRSSIWHYVRVLFKQGISEISRTIISFYSVSPKLFNEAMVTSIPATPRILRMLFCV